MKSTKLIINTWSACEDFRLCKCSNQAILTLKPACSFKTQILIVASPSHQGENLAYVVYSTMYILMAGKAHN